MSAFSTGLMGGLGDTLSFLGQRYLSDKDEKDKQAREDAKMAQQAGYNQQLELLKEKAAQAHAEFEKSIAPPSFQTYEATDDQGRTVKRTVKSTYDMGKHARNDEQVGEATVPKPAPLMHNVINGDTEYTQKYDPMTGETSTVGSPGRRWKADSGRDTAHDDAVAERQSATEENKNRRVALTATNAKMREFDNYGSSDKERTFSGYGIDPKAADAHAKLHAAILADNLGSFGLDPIAAKSKDSGGLMGSNIGAPKAATKPANLPDNAKLSDDGNWYIPNPKAPGKWMRVNPD